MHSRFQDWVMIAMWTTLYIFRHILRLEINLQENDLKHSTDWWEEQVLATRRLFLNLPLMRVLVRARHQTMNAEKTSGHAFIHSSQPLSLSPPLLPLRRKIKTISSGKIAEIPWAMFLCKKPDQGWGCHFLSIFFTDQKRNQNKTQEYLYSEDGGSRLETGKNL